MPLTIYFEPFLGFGFYYDSDSYSDSSFWTTFLGWTLTSFDPFLAFGFSSYDYSDYAGLTIFLGWALIYFEPFLAFGFYSSEDYSD